MIRLGIYNIMFVHDNNVSVSCTVPLLTLHKAAYLQIAYGKLHSATFQRTLYPPNGGSPNKQSPSGMRVRRWKRHRGIRAELGSTVRLLTV